MKVTVNPRSNITSLNPVPGCLLDAYCLGSCLNLSTKEQIGENKIAFLDVSLTPSFNKPIDVFEFQMVSFMFSASLPGVMSSLYWLPAEGRSTSRY